MRIDKDSIVIGVALAVVLTASAAFAVVQFPTLDGVTAQSMNAIEMGRARGAAILLDIQAPVRAPGAP